MPSQPPVTATWRAYAFSLRVTKEYASVILSYVRDWFSNPQRTSNEPIYVIDVGAGFGKLGFLIMYHLFEMKALWPPTENPPFM